MKLSLPITLLVASAFIIPLGVMGALPMDWRRPSKEEVEKAIGEGKWKIKPISSGGHKGIIRVRVKDLNPDEQFTLRVIVTNMGTGEESMIETPPLTTEIEQIA